MKICWRQKIRKFHSVEKFFHGVELSDFSAVERGNPRIDRRGGNEHRRGMKIMAMDFSADAAGLALLEDGVARAACSVDAAGRRSQEIFGAAEALLEGAGWTIRELAGFAAGRGPGNYTGLRVSLTAAQGWALPGRKFVWAASGAAARAAELLQEHPDWSAVVVWGAARRGTVWAGRYVRADRGLVAKEGDWQTMPADRAGEAWGGAAWDEPGQSPKAEWIGRLYFAGHPGEAAQPIYLHPAVAAPAGA
jgi:tRNA threonylcarbamoyl adenosine modification protein YeaZ